MGYIKAPYIAQGLAWALISYRLPSEADLGLTLPSSAVCPGVIHIATGFIFVIIDTVLVASSDPRLGAAWSARLKRNAIVLRAAWKMCEIYVWPGTTTHMSFYGLQWRFPREGMEWRIDPAHIEGWHLWACEQPRPTRRNAFKAIFDRSHTMDENMSEAERAFADSPAVQDVLTFMRSAGRRSFATPWRGAKDQSDDNGED